MTLAFEKKVARGSLRAKDREMVHLFLGKVLRRYLWPTESNGRPMTPCLVNIDLLPGNFKLR